MTNLLEAFYARLYGFYRPTTDFTYNPSQPRDKNGKWVSARGAGKASKVEAKPTTDKMWTGVSAHPTQRKVPTSKVKFPIEKKDDYETQGEANRRFARGVFDTDLGNGYHSKVTQVESFGSDGMTVRGVIVHKGKEVGTFDRTLTPERGNKLSVDHTELMINPVHRSKGLADRFNAHAVAKYQEMGVDRITLHAGDEVGGFAWARQGFRWATPEVAQKVGNRALDMVEADIKYLPRLRGEEAKKLSREVKAVRKALNAGEDVQPIHIAALGERVKWQSLHEASGPYTNWPGKRAMMRSSWEGVYYFDANQAVTAAAVSLEHSRLRPQFQESKPPSLRASVLEHFNYNPKQPRDKEGKWTAHRAGITDLSRESLDRAMTKGMAGVFGDAPGGVTPWPRAPRRKGEQLYDKELVREALSKAPRLEGVDARILYATQPGLVKSHAEYYMGDAYKRTGKPSADQDQVGNQFPVVYVNKRGQHLILAGHHRALRALIMNEDLQAVVVREEA